MNGLTTDAIICIQYCVISYICVGSLLYFIVVTNRSAEHSSELFFYKLAMGFAALCSFTDIMFALLAAMLSGRIIWGAVRTILYGLGRSPFGWMAFLSGAFLNSVPGIIVQLILIPQLVFALRKYTRR